MSEHPIITRAAVEEGALAYAKFRQHLAGDIWHIPSVRAYERWEGEHAEAACAALVELLELTNYRDDTNVPDGPYSRGFRDACQFIARSIFGAEPVPDLDTPYAATEPNDDDRYNAEYETAAEANEGWR